MTWFQGTAADSDDLLDQLEQIATASNATAVINAGGSGYSVGDILTVVGGTGTHAAKFEVTAVSSGVVTGIRTYSGGAYSVNPGTGASTTVSPSGGTGCTLDTTLVSTGWETQRYLKDLGPTDAAIVGGGTGYAVNDILTVSGGTFTTAATLRVLAESAGVITDVSVETSGQYSVAPSNPVSVTGGGGSGATFTLTFHGSSGRNQLILKGVGSGLDEIYVGVYSYVYAPVSAYNWELAGFTGYLPAQTWENQPGRSPAGFNDQGTFQGGQYFLLANTTVTYWMSITPRRIVTVAKIGSTYSSMHVGLLNAFATTSEYPYPLCIAGQVNNHLLAFNSSPPYHSSIADPIASTNGATLEGPIEYRDPGGQWKRVRNSVMSGASRVASYDRVVYPSGQSVGPSPQQGPVAVDDRVVANGTTYWVLIIPNSGVPGAQAMRLVPTPNSDGDISVPIPCTIVSAEALSLVGEMDGVYWVSAEQASTIVSEDTITIGTDRYKIFQSGTRTELFSFFCVKEA
jgi:hypothetical protein